jgi:hypothetical protein
MPGGAPSQFREHKSRAYRYVICIFFSVGLLKFNVTHFIHAIFEEIKLIYYVYNLKKIVTAGYATNQTRNEELKKYIKNKRPRRH